MFSGEDIIDANTKLPAEFPCLFRHILQPSDDGHAVAHLVVVVSKTFAEVFCGIVGQGGSSDDTANGRFLVADGDGASSLLHFAHSDNSTVVEHQRIGIFLFRLADDVPHLVVEDGMLLGKAYHPVARRLVAPVGVGYSLILSPCFLCLSCH